MTAATERGLVLFPGALGDFLCFLPALLGLRSRHAGGLTLVARQPWLALLRLADMRCLSMDDRAVADLFASSSDVDDRTRQLLGGHARVYSWTGFGNDGFAARLARASGGDVRVYPFRGMAEGEHAVDYFARCAGVVPARLPVDVFAVDVPWGEAFCRAHALDGKPWLLIHPGSGSRRKNWTGFTALAAAWRRLGRPVVVLSGPAEEEAAALLAGADTIGVRDLTLARVAALLRQAPLYAGNDSGISHLAGALGTRGVALFGDSVPANWAPRGDSIRVVHAREACSRCGEGVFCNHRLPVARVLDGLEGRRPSSAGWSRT